MKIIVDAFGGDNAPLEILRGCAEAVAEYGFEIVLVGKKDEIKRVAKENNIFLYKMTIIDAPDVIGMDEKPTEIMKSKINSSMAVGIKSLAAGEGDVFVSAGNSGALAVGATMIAKRIKGIKRCAFAPVMPKNKGCFMLIDSGANVDCRPEMLKQFGIMGSIYMEKVMKIENPRVGLANVGVEEHKGGEFQKDTYKLLKDSPINFIGNVEARDIPDDGADVIVTDGFTGNIILKLFEGVALTLMGKVKEVFSKNAKTKLAGAIVLPEMKELKNSIDYDEFGGAPIMGVAKPVFKIHGNAKDRAVKNALRLAAAYAEANVIEEITKYMSTQDIQSEE